MHPNTYLRTLWRNEFKSQVFVAMSFEPRFVRRYIDVLQPAIEARPLAGLQLSAYRVDNSQTGDSILTDIADGIAHSILFLADVSVIDEGHFSEQPIRNGNVMYEVGLALACRSPSEVLLIRDDRKKFLFDVSTIPHLTIDFGKIENAIETLRIALADRLSETKKIADARVTIAAKGLTPVELKILANLASDDSNHARDFSQKKVGGLSIPVEGAISKLLQKGCIQAVGINEETNGIYYSLTPFGKVVFSATDTLLPKLSPI